MPKAKTAEKKPTQNAPIESTVAATQEATVTWEDLTARIGAPSAGDVDLYAVDDPVDELIGRGRQIRSSKILTDFKRWAGQVADDVARKGPTLKIKGFSVGLLRVAVADGTKLRAMLESQDAGTRSQGIAQGSEGIAATTAFDRGTTARDELAAALRTAYKSDKAALKRVDVAYGSAKDAPSLASALLALVKVARGELGQKASKPAARLADGGVDEAYLAGLESLAAEIKTTGEKAKGPRTGHTVTQADLDTQDGVCLVHMERFRELFGPAHDSDPRVPHLVPIATRSFFSRKASSPVAGTPAAEPPPVVTGGKQA